MMMFQLHRKRPSAMLISLITAYALLAEAMIAGMSQPQLAPVVVAVAHPADAGLRLRRLQRLHAVPARGLERGTVRLGGAVRDRRQASAPTTRRPWRSSSATSGSEESKVPTANRLAGKFGLNRGAGRGARPGGRGAGRRAGAVGTARARWSARATRPASACPRARCWPPGARTRTAGVRGRAHRPGRGRADHRRRPRVLQEEFAGYQPLQREGKVVHPLTVKGCWPARWRCRSGSDPAGRGARRHAGQPDVHLPGERPPLPGAVDPVPAVHVARTWRTPCWPTRDRRRSAASWWS